MSLSERLKEARTKKGLSQSDLAKKVKLHYTQIGRYENKGAQPSADILSKLADALDVTTDYLMSGSQDEMAEGISDKERVYYINCVIKYNIRQSCVHGLIG